jgi:hypothetical protein
MIAAIQNHVTEKFVYMLNESIRGYNDSPIGLLNMGCAYVMFFARNPQYFSFLFSRVNIKVDFADNFDDGDYEPFAIYKRLMFRLFNLLEYPAELRLKTIISHWAFVHGLASVAVVPGSGSIEEWEQRVVDILSNNYFLGGYSK